VLAPPLLNILFLDIRFKFQLGCDYALFHQSKLARLASDNFQKSLIVKSCKIVTRGWSNEIKKFFLVAILAFFVLVSVAVPRVSSSVSLAKPVVTLPSGWTLTKETDYPSFSSEHDPLGGGFLEYENVRTAGVVLIYYEDSMGAAYTNDQLRAEAEKFYVRDLGKNFTESGVMNVAGVTAGYAQTYNATIDLNSLELIFTKGNYYINVYTIYPNNNPSAMAIVNSISVPTQTPTAVYAFITIAIVAVALSVLLVKRRRTGRSVSKHAVIGKQRAITLGGRVATGYLILDKLLYGGLPEKFSVVLTSPSCDERDALIESFLETGAKNGEPTFCVTANPSFGAAFTKQFPSNFYLFICNPQTDALKESSSNLVMLKGVENLTNISIALTKVIHNLNPSVKDGKRICISLVSDAVLYNGVVQTRKWLTELIPELKSEGFTILAVMDPKMHTQEDLYKILSLFDGEINIEEKQMKKLERFLKVVRMSNQEYIKAETILPEE
jgi:KaiC/GvpD/RAD55 family RecA-like ATPase/opacity protein-like surface antigen